MFTIDFIKIFTSTITKHFPIRQAIMPTTMNQPEIARTNMAEDDVVNIKHGGHVFLIFPRNSNLQNDFTIIRYYKPFISNLSKLINFRDNQNGIIPNARAYRIERKLFDRVKKQIATLHFFFFAQSFQITRIIMSFTLPYESESSTMFWMFIPRNVNISHISEFPE